MTPYPTYQCILDGGPNNPLPVTVSGYWEGDADFIVESVTIILKDDKPYDLVENLTPATLDHLAQQVEDQNR